MHSLAVIEVLDLVEVCSLGEKCFNYSIYLYLYMCSLNKLYIVYLIANVVNIGHFNSCYLVIYLRDVISSLNEILNMTEM